MRLSAPAKLNLSLEVLGRRPDGYHQVVTVLHTIGLADELTVRPAEEMSLTCEGLKVPQEENLVWRAARLLQEQAGSRQGAAITLKKRIPVAAGLGGGSSDAAATLRGLNDLWGLRLSEAALLELASRLGADVPFFLSGGCALAEGRGERLTPLPPLTGWWAVVVCPMAAIEHKTAYLYGLLNKSDFTDGSTTREMAERIRQGGVSVEDLRIGHNAFERVTSQVFPGLEAARRAFRGAEVSWVRLTGTGPSMYTLVASQAEGEGLMEALPRTWGQAYLARLCGAPMGSH